MRGSRTPPTLAGGAVWAKCWKLNHIYDEMNGVMARLLSQASQPEVLGMRQIKRRTSSCLRFQV